MSIFALFSFGEFLDRHWDWFVISCYFLEYLVNFGLLLALILLCFYSFALLRPLHIQFGQGTRSLLHDLRSDLFLFLFIMLLGDFNAAIKLFLGARENTALHRRVFARLAAVVILLAWLLIAGLCGLIFIVGIIFLVLIARTYAQIAKLDVSSLSQDRFCLSTLFIWRFAALGLRSKQQADAPAFHLFRMFYTNWRLFIPYGLLSFQAFFWWVV